MKDNDRIFLPENVSVNDISNGDHTFNDLYHYITVLFIGFACSNSDKAWKTNRNIHGDDVGCQCLGVDLGNLGNLGMYIEPLWFNKLADGIKTVDRIPKNTVLSGNAEKFLLTVAKYSGESIFWKNNKDFKHG